MKQLCILIGLMLLVGCNDNEPYEDVPQDENTNTIAEDFFLEVEIPANFPAMTYDLSTNPPTQNGFVLGKKLFYDGRLASDGVVSCGFCHIQSFAFTHHTHITSHGVDGIIGKRNAQPIQNMAFMDEFMWDGAAGHLDAQPIIPLTSEFEMNETVTNVIEKLKADPEYVTLFAAAFNNQEVNPDNMLKALSQFMVMMTSAESKFDRFERGDGTTLTESETLGKAVFDNKCASCHAGTLFTDQSYRNNGLPMDSDFMDIGRERVTGLATDNRKFKVPSLRNIEITFPYMHDGRIPTLAGVLDFYASGMVDSETLDPIFRQADGSLGIPLSETEKEQLLAFLRTLTDDNFLLDERFSEF